MVSNDFLSLDMVEISWFGRTSLHASCILNTRSIVEEDDHLCVCSNSEAWTPSATEAGRWLVVNHTLPSSSPTCSPWETSYHHYILPVWKKNDNQLFFYYYYWRRVF